MVHQRLDVLVVGLAPTCRKLTRTMSRPTTASLRFCSRSDCLMRLRLAGDDVVEPVLLGLLLLEVMISSPALQGLAQGTSRWFTWRRCTGGPPGCGSRRRSPRAVAPVGRFPHLALGSEHDDLHR